MQLTEFERIEKTLDLGQDQIWGVYWWDLVRYPLYKKLIGEKTIRLKPSLGWVQIFMICKSLVSLLRIRRNVDMVIYTHPRSIKNKGRYIDIYSDTVINDLSNSGLNVLPLIPNAARAGRVYEQSSAPLDFVLLVSGVLRKLVCFFTPFIKMIWRGKKLKHLSNQLEMLTYDEIATLVIQRVICFKVEKFLYSTFLFLSSPKHALLVVSAGNEAFVSACAARNVPCYELQHGSPGRGKLNYDYSSGVGKHYFPDYLLVFGEFFRDNCIYPISKANILSLGYPFLEEKKRGFKESERNRIVIVTQPAIDREIVDQVSLLIKNNPLEKISILIHPQYAGIDTPMEKFKNIDNVSFCYGNEIDIHALFLNAKAVFGCYSTALFEASYLGAKVFIFNNSRLDLVEGFISRGWFGSFESYCSGDLNELRSFKFNYFDDYSVSKLLELIGSVEREV